jgi:hypothetical protein
MLNFKDTQDIEQQLQSNPSILTDKFLYDNTEFHMIIDNGSGKTFASNDKTSNIAISFDAGWVYARYSLNKDICS